ncbi:SLC13 family permease [uncultured Intestinimonas sp.]|uniref:SLC13 family permease n=1 Tax=uncultured Intestinimonas sp. TaxID=1689265 RepID=UPI00262C1B5D|nr:SLC13 family permease [uncultured Intestinimonas sp.]
MTATVGLIVFMLAIVISIILGTKLKMNIGMVALAFTFLIGVTLSGLSGRSVSGLFPTNIFVTQLVATFFYGFASLNGAFNGIADRIIYRTKKVKGALPFVVLLCTILLSMMGAGAEATPVIMSPIAFMLAAEAGFHPILASLAVWVGSVCTIGATWTPGGAVAYSIWSPHLGEEAADATSLYIMLLLIAIGFITMLVVDFIYRKELKEIEMEEPAPFTPIQKRSLMIVVIALLLMLIPAVLEALAPNPVTKWISTHITVQVVCLVGSLIFVIMGLADPKEVFTKKIPWNSLITLAGMGTLVALAGELGIVDAIGGWIGDSVPAKFMPLMLVLVAGLLSYVVAASSVIYPLFAPMVPALAAASGLSPILIAVSIMLGANISSFSPVSTGGSMAMLGASEEQRDIVMTGQFRFAMYFLIIFVAIFGVLGLLGVFG